METNKIKYSTIQQYLEGKLDPKAMHELEKQALDDPFLAEAIEGYSTTDIPAGPHLSMLQKQLEERIAQQQENKSMFYFTWQRLSVAAAAGLMFISAGILFWMKGDRRDPQLANQKHVEVKLTPADSLGLSSGVTGTIAGDSVAAAESLPSDKLLADVGKNKGLRLSKATPAVTDSLRSGEDEMTIAGNTPIRTLNTPVTQSSDDSLSRIESQHVASLNKQITGRVAGVAMSRGLHSGAVIKGRVISKEDGAPLPGVIVKSEGTSGVITNADGEFALADSSARKISFAYIGYESQVADVKPGEDMTVVMEPGQGSLNEVVVAGAGTVRKPIKPEPVNGWTKYRTYLNDNIRLPKQSIVPGKVIVVFKVNSSGILSDFRIRKGLNEACNKEAIRLIEDGPAWRPAVGKDVEEASVTVVFTK